MYIVTMATSRQDRNNSTVMKIISCMHKIMQVQNEVQTNHNRELATSQKCVQELYSMSMTACH